MEGLHFSLASEPGPSCLERLRMAHVVSADRTVWPAHIQLDGRTLTVRRLVHESGVVHIPWQVETFGDVVLQTSSLMERPEPYSFTIELARGQLSKVRNQCAEWEESGLDIPPAVSANLKKAGALLRNAILSSSENSAERDAMTALALALFTGEEVTGAYARRAVAARYQSQSTASMRLDSILEPVALSQANEALFLELFHHASLSLSWRRMERKQGEPDWVELDNQLAWCASHGLGCSVGPLIDFHTESLPDWLWLWEGDNSQIVDFMTKFAESCIRRFKGRVEQWVIVARANSAEVLGLNEEQMLGIVARLFDVAARADPDAPRVLAIDQPWGEYQATDDRTYSPYSFATTLVRTQVPITAISLEFAMGYAPGGSYCRSLLDLSQLLDAYHAIDLPLQVRLHCPSGLVEPKPGTHAGTTAGYWHAPPDETVHAQWMKRAVAVSMAKPFVKAITCGCFKDRADLSWPMCGLLHYDMNPKPAYERIKRICAKYG